MKSILTLCAFITAAFAQHVDGPVNITRHPYLLELLNNQKHWCGAILINSRIVLSTAHCTYQVPKENLTILAGSSISQNVYTKQYKISSIRYYKKYDPKRPYNDISVIFPILSIDTEEKYVVPIHVAEMYYPPGTEVIVSGWKLVKGRHMILSHKLTLKGKRTCKADYKKLNITVFEGDLCAYEEDDAVCQAESGGALIIRNKLVGIVSRIYYPYCMLYPGLYTSFVHYKPFVKSTVKKVLSTKKKTKKTKK
ncbi:hypothetical protein ILUMI_03513 [Ignelater luminosus]|uniref:Peptidase S1 domain-containing protein n=1 Tax=Ignelater luminosus TaxID=2038154 RepID=A0A8K0DFN4_IGNLU|nr:hypothetical protein ILUMI_03513 [Ignelater luminosus]